MHYYNQSQFSLIAEIKKSLLVFRLEISSAVVKHAILSSFESYTSPDKGKEAIQEPDIETFLALSDQEIFDLIADKETASNVKSVSKLRHFVYRLAYDYLTDPKIRLSEDSRQDAQLKNEKLRIVQERVDALILQWLEEVLKETRLAAKAKEDIGERQRGLSVLKIIRGLRCNYNCRFCLEQTNDEEQSKYIEEFSDLNYSRENLFSAMLFARMAFQIKEINFSGGETLANKPKQLIEEIAMAKELGFPQITILTNGSLLTKELIDQYCEAGLTNLTVSLHTRDSRNYDFLVRPKNNRSYHQHILEMVKYAAEKENLRVRINVAATKDFTEPIDEIIKWAEELGVDEVTVNEMITANQFSKDQYIPLGNEISGYVKSAEFGWGLSLFKRGNNQGPSVAICRFGGEDFAHTQSKDLYLLPDGKLSQFLYEREAGIDYM